MLSLAVRSLRHRIGSAAATLVALAVGVMILMSMGTLVESGLRYSPAPDKYAASTVVVAHREMIFTSKDIDGEISKSTVPLPEAGTVPADLVDRIRDVTGVTKVGTEPAAGHPGRVDTIEVVADGPKAIAEVTKLAQAADVEAYTGNDRGLLEQPEGASTRVLLMTIGATFGGYVAMLIVFVVAGTIGLSIRHRRRDLALLRAVAATPGQIRRMLVAESTLLALVAAVVGVPAGLLATVFVHDQLVTRGFVAATFPMSNGLLPALAAVLLTALVAVCAALIAARRVTGIRPAEALGEAAIEPPRSGKVRLVFGLLTLVGAGSSSTFAVAGGGQTALTGAIGMLYLFVLAVALLAPWINGFAARLLTPVLRTVFGSSGYLAGANLRANAGGMATVLTALVLSVGFGGSVWFLQDNLQHSTLTQHADGTLADRALVSPAGLPASAAARVRAIPGVQAVTPLRHTSVLVRMFGDGTPVDALAIDPRDAAETIAPDVVEGSLSALNSENIAISSLRASSQKWKLGDRVELWLGDGTPLNAQVAAIYDRGLGFGDVIMSRSTIDGHTRINLDDQLLIRTKPGTSVEGNLTHVAARYPGSSVVSTADLTGRLSKDLALGAWLNKLLIGVMVGYAALAAANTMVMAALARRRELALLRLVGVTRRQIKNMVHAEQAGLLGVALVIGASIAAIALTLVVNALTGTPVPYVPTLGWIAVLCGATLLALLTTILPIGRLLRASPLEHLGSKE
ncbi:putative ABC transport system permease protein [Streptomyces sp. LBL]|uniref:FtsX-like permease family protein n=1 Tax=Streptomyces sp. LBL TaxID=2940562 RepID=UPI002473A420|nr:ABC transporter permease [Streptomyces sp. LBL]MDH6628791.1 putative ABC transport system permease protein [Streptomyces sp. LBL]